MDSSVDDLVFGVTGKLIQEAFDDLYAKYVPTIPAETNDRQQKSVAPSSNNERKLLNFHTGKHTGSKSSLSKISDEADTASASSSYRRSPSSMSRSDEPPKRTLLSSPSQPFHQTLMEFSLSDLINAVCDLCGGMHCEKVPCTQVNLVGKRLKRKNQEHSKSVISRGSSNSVLPQPAEGVLHHNDHNCIRSNTTMEQDGVNLACASETDDTCTGNSGIQFPMNSKRVEDSGFMEHSVTPSPRDTVKQKNSLEVSAPKQITKDHKCELQEVPATIQRLSSRKVGNDKSSDQARKGAEDLPDAAEPFPKIVMLDPVTPWTRADPLANIVSVETSPSSTGDDGYDSDRSTQSGFVTRKSPVMKQATSKPQVHRELPTKQVKNNRITSQDPADHCGYDTSQSRPQLDVHVPCVPCVLTALDKPQDTSNKRKDANSGQHSNNPPTPGQGKQVLIRGSQAKGSYSKGPKGKQRAPHQAKRQAAKVTNANGEIEKPSQKGKKHKHGTKVKQTVQLANHHKTNKKSKAKAEKSEKQNNRTVNVSKKKVKVKAKTNIIEKNSKSHMNCVSGKSSYEVKNPYKRKKSPVKSTHPSTSKTSVAPARKKRKSDMNHDASEREATTCQVNEETCSTPEEPDNVYGMNLQSLSNLEQECLQHKSKPHQVSAPFLNLFTKEELGGRQTRASQGLQSLFSSGTHAGGIWQSIVTEL